MDRLSQDQLRLVPTNKLIEQIHHLLAELKNREPTDVQRTVAEAESSIGRAIRTDNLEPPALASKVDAARLSDREREVLSLLGEGLKTSVVAERLQLSVHTIETYREKIKSKLQLKDAAELWHLAVRWAIEKGRSAATEN